MKVIPIGDRILIKTEKTEEKTKTGLFIPQTAQEKTQTGVVEEVSEGCEIKVSKGQKVMYDKYAGASIQIDDKDFLIVKSEDVIAILE